jgi:hypothetical protein
LTESLLDSKFFSSVTPAGAQAPGTDYVIEAGVLGVSRRNYAGRVWGGGDRMRIGGALLGPETSAGTPRPVIAHWECVGANSGGFLGGIVLPGAGNSGRAASNNVKNIAKAFARVLSDKDLKKDLTKQAEQAVKDRSADALKGETRQEKRKWREKTEWDRDDYGDEIRSFMASSKRDRLRGVDALWVTDAAYQAHQKLLPMLDLSDALLRPCFLGGCGDGEEVPQGTLIDIEPIERFKGQDVYLIALSFNAALSETPVIWNAGEVRGATSLGRAGQAGASVTPLEFLDGEPYAVGLIRKDKCATVEQYCPAIRPVWVAFPTTLPDGSPLVRAVDDVLELRTLTGGRKVTLTFKLEHLDAKSPEELKTH